MSWSFGIQRELPLGIFSEITYVSNQGRRLLRQPDINQAPFQTLVENAALPSNQRANTNSLRPFKGYSGIRMRISDANSSYHAFQAFVSKRKGSIRFTSSYTWSKVLTDAGGNGDDPEDWRQRTYRRGRASFDRPHALVLTYTYQLPFFKRGAGIARTVLGRWEVSGITRFQSGGRATVNGNTSTGNRRADYVGGPIQLPERSRRVSTALYTSPIPPAPIWARIS